MVKLPKRLSKKIIYSSVVLTICLICFAPTAFARSSGYYVTSNSRTEKSIVGIPVYTIGVSGQFYTNGKKVSKESDATVLNDTHYPGWSVQSSKAYWSLKTDTGSVVKNVSEFFYGLDTQWIEIGIQSYTDTITANATP